MIHIPFILNLVLACLSMAVRDFSSTMETVAQARGASQQAAQMDALQDLAVAVTTLTGAGTILVHGITIMTLSTILAIALTSYLGTLYWTGFASRHTPTEPVLLDHGARIGRIERDQEAVKTWIRKVQSRASGVGTEGRSPRLVPELESQGATRAQEGPTDRRLRVD